jgi:TDG/mug DNA glycosylase family protein
VIPRGEHVDGSGTLPDIVETGLDVLFCGINPGQAAAKAGHHFQGNGNRFWKTLHDAGFTPGQLTAVDDARLPEFGYGLTAVVPRASRSADEVTGPELLQGLRDLEAKVRRWKPRVVAFLGKAAWTVHTGSTQVTWGRQGLAFGGAEVWVLPNPSGLNRHFSLAELVRAYRELREYVGAAEGISRPMQAPPEKWSEEENVTAPNSRHRRKRPAR